MNPAINAYLAGVQGTGPRLSLKAAAALVGKSQTWLSDTLQGLDLPRHPGGRRSTSRSPYAARKRELYRRNKKMKPW